METDGYGRTLIYQDNVGYQVGDISGDGRWIALSKAKGHRRQRHPDLGTSPGRS